MKILLTTTKNEKEAQKISKELLKQKLAACCNIIPGIKSFYWWKGRIESDSECLLLCKTSAFKQEKAAELVKKMHSYEVPSIESFELKNLNSDYKKWLETTLKQP